MTTEVLRNMLYADSPAINGLGYVVMDEVHYLADRFRGAVWEEVIIHLPQSVTLVSLSATVSNAEEFADWLVTVRGAHEGRRQRGPAGSAVAAHAGRQPGVRPVLAAAGRPRGGAGATPRAASPPASAAPRSSTRNWCATSASTSGASTRGTAAAPAARAATTRTARATARRRGPTSSPGSTRAGLLPAITFVFSRNGCDAAVHQCLLAGLRLTDEVERAEIAEIIDRRTGSLPEEDLHVLGFWEWREGLLAGLAAHHAGLVPAFKETVEECFVRGLVKAVFATETLALGINMPARSVVLERLVKWNGEAHVDVTPGEYTQLTGRAGRRGIDVEGHAVVVWAPGVDPAVVAGLASTRTFPLKSSFRPSYNMAVNLVSSFGRARARELLASSFAQFQADRSVVGLARAAARHEQDAAPLRRRDALRPGGRRPVRRAAAADRRAREGAVPRLPGQAADGGGRGAGGAAARRRHPRAVRTPAGTGRRAGPRGSPTSPTRARWCSPRTSGPAGWARSTSRRR